MALMDKINSILKKNAGPTMKFRGKDMVYQVENTALHSKIILGTDGKLRNPWNEPVLLRVTLNKTNGKLVIYIAKEQAGIQDARAIYSSDQNDGVYSDAFPVSDEELAQFRALLTQIILENDEHPEQGSQGE